MKTKAIVLVVFLLVLVTAARAGQYKVTTVCEGDTIKAQGHDIEIEVRLMGIDAPETCKRKGELGQPYGQIAKKHLTGLIYGKVVDIVSYGFDQHNRLLGVVYFEGKNINLEMVKAGLAEVCRHKISKKFDLMPYLQAEQEARNIQRGMWSISNIYVSPRVWRKGKEERKKP